MLMTRFWLPSMQMEENIMEENGRPALAEAKTRKNNEANDTCETQKLIGVLRSRWPRAA